MNAHTTTAKTDCKTPTIIVTRQYDLFAAHFAGQLNATVFVFSEGSKALAAYRDLAQGCAPNVAADYAALADGDTGFRLVKAIRSLEVERASPHQSAIYLMAEKPTEIDQILARKAGAQGVLKKEPKEVEGIFWAARNPAESAEERRKKKHPGTRPVFSQALRARAEHWNGVLRRFIGSAATKVREEAMYRMSEGTIERTEKAYIDYLVTRIPSAEMRLGFLAEVNKALKEPA